MKSPVKQVELMDCLRGIAILAVLLFHTLGTVYGYDALPWRGWFRDFSVPVSFFCFLPLSFGQAGVAIFFVVSGFCIHTSFQQPGQRWGGFFIRRIFRIYPAYLAALFFFALIEVEHFRLSLSSRQIWMQLLTHAFLIHNFHPATISGINASFWSLAIEAQLYLLYPALLALVARLGWRRTMVILAGSELLIRGVDGLMQTAGATNTLGGNISWLFVNSPLGYWFSWALGAYIADAFWKKQPLPFMRSSPMGWLALAVFSYFVKPLDSFRFLLFAVLTAVVASKLLGGTKPEIKTTAFSMTVLRKIGLWSYSIYLLHEPLLNIYSYAIVWAIPAEYRSAPITFLLVAATWLAVIPFSVLCYNLFELPGIARGKRIIQKMDIRHVPAVEPERLHANGRVGMVKGGHCLMMGALLAIAAGSFLVSVKLAPREPGENNDLAWSLATSPEATARNGALAVKLAEDACQRTQYKETIMVGTLAAAYAEAGRFDEAVSTAQKACSLASQSGNRELLKKNQELLALYLKHQPYRDRQANTRN